MERNRLLFINASKGTGIGQFGLAFARALEANSFSVDYADSDSARGSFLGQLILTLRARGWMVANVGLTNWGRSPFRNFLGFLTIGLRQWLVGRTIVALHTVIEVIEPEDAGYGITPSLQLGAHLSVELIRGCKIITFSTVMRELLRTHYKIDVAGCMPVPCDAPRPHPAVSRDGRPTVVFVGYLSRYKGVENLLQAASILGGRVAIRLIGGPHAILKNDSSYVAWFTQQSEIAARLGVDMPGFLSDEQLRDALASAMAGILPYSSTNGASASFATLAAAGLPVVASDLPEFRWLKELGAGVLLVRGTPEEYAAAVRRLVSDSELRLSLGNDQRRFAEENGWPSLVQIVSAIVRRAPRPPDPACPPPRDAHGPPSPSFVDSRRAPEGHGSGRA